MNKKNSARLKLAFSMAVFGTIGLFVRMIPLPSAEIALYRAILAVVLIGVFLLVTRQKIPFGIIKKQLPLLIVSGVAVGFNWILLFEAYKYTTVSAATLSYYFAPVIVTLLCPIIFREKMTAKRWICFFMSTLGIILITGNGGGAASNHLLGVILGLCAACLYAFAVLVNKAIKNVGGIHRTFLQFVAACAVLVPYTALTGGFHISVLDTTGIAALLTVGILHTGVTYCLYFSSLKDISGQKAALLSYIDPLVAVVISVFVLGEPITVLQIAGGLLVLGFTLWNELGQDE